MCMLMRSPRGLSEVQESTHFTFATVSISFTVVPFCGVIDRVFKWRL